MPLQHTIQKSVSLSGTGLHMGEMTKVTLHPAPDNDGIRFVRADVKDSPEIEADIDNVVDIARGTTIGKNGVKVHSVEHLMSAFAGLEIDNCRVEIDAPEIPLMDGSALPFVELIQRAGIAEQESQREILVIDDSMLVEMRDNITFGILPSNNFRATIMIDYNHPALGAQHTTLFALHDYVNDFAPARTFCFLSEIEKLRESGLIKGGRLDNAVVVQDIELTREHISYMRKLFDWKGPIEKGDNGFVNSTKLRFPNELARHKMVDMLGDFYLLGRPLLCHVQAARTGHAANIEMAKKIREYLRKKKKKTEAGESPVPFEEICAILPHRYPFLLIDRVLEIEPRKKIVAVKNVTYNEPFFQGHFPGDPVMPGVLQIEAMAQAGGIIGLHGKKFDKGNAIAFLGIDKARFRGWVKPGDVLRIEVETLQDRRNTMRFGGKCYVGDKLVCEAELFAMLGKKGDAI
ncbi:MAG TPA: bifunctional UDP-3-O-[3-hydroxymyristoyl] N-acetylglucosamine deacetylase/3-hydroxyacyl-ACP dehydratase [Chitinivibrionales bacterium]|nr:bifunctional UDP-3-O-[3-hydroxymyristoyl] N-acetylglucosamine deacetylase/3-hydroxyacyl-ACP dehydratase [Chitinivibrionales bacterium]